ncbi:class I SAM-dependent methyltransferase [Pseudoduganella sp. UC29_106]|uniref:class I SAM-dependent methyltransferase n=1 Tax=Pseudoduganella sp. UC29_106 TaxID=3374553 RepID=UPI003757AB6D
MKRNKTTGGAKGAAAVSAAASPRAPLPTTVTDIPEVKPGQSVALLQELHILTRDGKLNQDSRRKLKQVYHLYQFIEPLLNDVLSEKGSVSLVDHGAGKSYLGFIIYDLFFKALQDSSHIYGIETREELVARSEELARKFDFPGMSFLPLSVAESTTSSALPEQIDIVTALHACNTATDDAIDFALKKHAKHIVLVPCCQAEVASVLRKNKGQSLGKNVLTELWRHPIHTREFGSQITNVLRCLQLEAHGYQVTVTELVGWEHSMKNELIVATYKNLPRRRPAERLAEVLSTVGLQEMSDRFYTGEPAPAAPVADVAGQPAATPEVTP